MSTPINWGILGFARIARTQAIPAIQKSGNGRVHAVASRDVAKLDEVRTLIPDVLGYSSYDNIINDPAIQAVYVPLPNSLHHQWAIAALNAGKHVLCEKPLALDAGQAREMAAAAQANGRLLMEGFMYRYTDCSRQIKAVLDSGELGEIHHINASFRFLLDRVGTIKMQPGLGGGALYDVGVYPINLLGMITGNMLPVACHAEAEFSDGVDVNTSVLLRYPSGLLATLHCGFNAHGQMAADIVGAKGRLIVPNPFLGDAGELTLMTAAGTQTLPVKASDRYAEQFRDFAAAIQEDRKPRLSLVESIHNLEVLDMIRASLKAH
jgi:D-xylose 1-dehydrogenase (NADP+, D-xylono-1,5-lactone-forming)